MKEKSKKISPQEIRSHLAKKNAELAGLLSSPLLEELSEKSSLLDYAPNDYVIRQHDPSDSLYILLSGRCRVNVNDEDLSFMDAGDMIGEMGVIQKTPRSASIIAIEPTTALRIPDHVFHTLLEQPQFSAWVMNLLTSRLKNTSNAAASVIKEMDEILQDHMELARVQRSLLPKELPVDPRFHIHKLYKPCAYAGGDYYDAFMLDDDTLFMIIADVTGHGAQASISMAIVRSFVHQGNLGKTPQTTLKRLNEYLLQYGPSQHFVTSQVAMVDFKKNKILYAYAGHPPVLHVRNHECKPLKAPRSFFLRFRPDADFKGASMSIKQGDRFAFYTDGVVETFDPEGQMYNIEGLEKFLTGSSEKKVSTLPNELDTDLHRFRQGSPDEDDVSFMVVEIT